MPRKSSLEAYQPPKKPSKYQGNIIFKGENSLNSDTHLYHGESDRLIDCTGLLHTLSTQHARVSTGKKIRESEKARSDANLQEQIASFKSNYGPEILDIILKGKLRLHILLNAESGREYEYDDLLALMNYIKSRQGLVEAYGKEKVQGYPALAFIQADVRYAIAKTQFKWWLEWYNEAKSQLDFNTKSTAKKNRNALDKKIKQQILMIRHLLMKTTSQGKKKEMNDNLFATRIIEMDTPEFAFSGLQLMDFGVLSQLFTDLEALKAKFLRNLAE
jgi:hypothetical protein